MKSTLKVHSILAPLLLWQVIHISVSQEVVYYVTPDYKACPKVYKPCKTLYSF